MRLNGDLIETTAGRVIFNDSIPESFRFINHSVDKKKAFKLISEVLQKEPLEVGIKLIDDLKKEIEELTGVLEMMQFMELMEKKGIGRHHDPGDSSRCIKPTLRQHILRGIII